MEPEQGVRLLRQRLQDKKGFSSLREGLQRRERELVSDIPRLSKKRYKIGSQQQVEDI